MSKVIMGVTAGTVLGATVGYMITNKNQMNKMTHSVARKCGSFFSGMMGM
jgi:chorismate synthase